VNVEEFEVELENTPMNPLELVHSVSPVIAKELVLQPDVAKLLVSGVPISVVARELGVSPQTVRRLMRTFEMSELIKIESKRLLRHLASRDLSKERYVGLVSALTQLIQTSRLLDDEPTAITKTFATQETIQRMQIGLFGFQNGSGCAGIGEVSQDASGEQSLAVHEESEEGRA